MQKRISNALREDTLANRQTAIDTRKQLEKQNYNLAWKSEKADINQYGFQKSYEIDDGRRIEYIGCIFFDINKQYEIRNIHFRTYHIFNQSYTGRQGFQDHPASSVQEAVDAVKKYFDQELSKHKFHIMINIHTALDQGNIPKFVNSIKYFKNMGVSWPELDNSIFEKSRFEIFQNILPFISSYLSLGQHNQHVTTTINDLKNTFGLDWPELSILDTTTIAVDSSAWNDPKIKKILIRFILEKLQHSQNEIKFQAVKWLELLRKKGCPWPELDIIEKKINDMKVSKPIWEAVKPAPVNKTLAAQAKKYGFTVKPGADGWHGYIDSPTATRHYYLRKASEWYDVYNPANDGNFGNTIYHNYKRYLKIKDKLPADVRAYFDWHHDTTQTIENANENEQIKRVTKNPLQIQYIDNPSENVQLAALRVTAEAIEFIKNPTKAAQLAAVKSDIFSIKYIKNPDKDVQLFALKHNLFYALGLIDRVHPDVWSDNSIKKEAIKTILEFMQSDHSYEQVSARSYYKTLRKKNCPWPELSVIEKHI